VKENLLSKQYAGYASLREASRCHRDEPRQRCLLTHYADVYAVLRNHDDFSSARNLNMARHSDSQGSISVLISDDPPRHTRIRSLVARWFTKSSLERLRPWIESTTSSLLSRIEDGTTDIMNVLAEPLPVMTIAKLLGLEPQDWRTYKRWSSAVFGRDDGRAKSARLHAVLAGQRCFANSIQLRKTYPLNDLISNVAECIEGDAGLSETDARSLCMVFLAAGSETTVLAIGNALNALLAEPAVWAALRSGEIPIGAVVNESLRFDSPVQIVRRIVKRDCNVNGLDLQSGETIDACLGAANRDPREFRNPDSFEPTRDLHRHIAFGHGIHFCLGAPLAGMVIEAALRGFVSRFHRIQLIGDGTRIVSDTLGGFASLPVVVER
jgi:cytochrome P450